MDFLEKGRISFNNIKFVVLDEADRMLDMGFVTEIDKMMNHSTMPGLVDRQTLLFSATFPEEVRTWHSIRSYSYIIAIFCSNFCQLSHKSMLPSQQIQNLAAKYLNNYVFYVVGTVGAANTDVVQVVESVQRNQKREILLNKLRDFISENGERSFFLISVSLEILRCYINRSKLWNRHFGYLINRSLSAYIRKVYCFIYTQPNTRCWCSWKLNGQQTS